MINTVALVGRLTFDPELRSIPNGTSVINFQIAVERAYQAQGQERQADFIDIVAWRQNAEFVSRWFKKGSLIAVEGSLQTRNFTDKDGNNRKAVEVVANRVSFCGSKAESGTGTGEAAPKFNEPAPSYANATNSDFTEIVDDDDDLPF